ncbi:hypothetical protein N657DRAFT_690151 [Parathielavia appendiculata]|uniref:Uncharacterized protein n=1 Tax=Parathielavia appendiculata TaxID=2587402 RepID=A0AAN6U2N2_9PEZI|nr:hypothetical protein N657DRAFT_690151 [Parathielavia appendiculata]
MTRSRYTPSYPQGPSAYPFALIVDVHHPSDAPIVDARPPRFDDPDALYFPEPPPPYQHPPEYESTVNQSAGEMPAQPTTLPRMDIRPSRRLEYPLKQEHHEAIARMVSLALDILEHQIGQIRQMRKWVDFFLQAIRHSFPPIEVENINRKTPLPKRLSGHRYYGTFGRHDWVAAAKGRCVSNCSTPSNENVMLHWKAAEAGVMQLDYEPIASMEAVKAFSSQGGDSRSRRRVTSNYRALLVDGALTIAHELVHCFVGLLSGYGYLTNTPKSLKPPGLYKEKDGEAGRTWELRVLGGYAGLSIVRERGEQIPRARIRLEWDNKEIEVDPEAVRAMVERNFEFPLKTIGKWETRQGAGNGSSLLGSLRLRWRHNLTNMESQTSSPTSTSSPSSGSGKPTKAQQSSYRFGSCAGDGWRKRPEPDWAPTCPSQTPDTREPRQSDNANCGSHITRSGEDPFSCGKESRTRGKNSSDNESSAIDACNSYSCNPLRQYRPIFLRSRFSRPSGGFSG